MTTDFPCEINRPLSTNRIIETRIFWFLNLFSKIWKIDKRYNTNETGDETELCPTPMLTLKKRRKIVLQIMFFFLLGNFEKI